MKKLLFLIITVLIVLVSSCSDDCEKEDPSLILVNNGTGRADIQIKTSGGNTENINNVEVGTSSEKRSFSPGEIEFTFAIQGITNDITFFLRVDYCTDYIVTIRPDNTVIANSTKRD